MCFQILDMSFRFGTVASQTQKSGQISHFLTPVKFWDEVSESERSLIVVATAGIDRLLICYSVSKPQCVKGDVVSKTRQISDSLTHLKFRGGVDKMCE